MKKEVTKKAEKVSQTGKETQPPHATLEIIRDSSKSDENTKVSGNNIETILEHAEKLQRAKKKLEWFMKKEEELQKVQEGYQDYLEKRTDEELFLETQPDLFDFELVLHSKDGNYGRAEKVVDIQNPNVINAFVGNVLAYITAKKQEAIQEIKELETNYAKKLIG